MHVPWFLVRPDLNNCSPYICSLGFEETIHLNKLLYPLSLSSAFGLYTLIAWVVMFAIALVVFLLRLGSIYNIDIKSIIFSIVEYFT